MNYTFLLPVAVTTVGCTLVHLALHLLSPHMAIIRDALHYTRGIDHLSIVSKTPGSYTLLYEAVHLTSKTTTSLFFGTEEIQMRENLWNESSFHGQCILKSVPSIYHFF